MRFKSGEELAACMLRADVACTLLASRMLRESNLLRRRRQTVVAQRGLAKSWREIARGYPSCRVQTCGGFNEGIRGFKVIA